MDTHPCQAAQKLLLFTMFWAQHCGTVTIVKAQDQGLFPCMVTRSDTIKEQEASRSLFVWFTHILCGICLDCVHDV